MITFGVMKFMDKHWEQALFAIIVLATAIVVSRIVRFLIGRFIRAASQKLKVDPTHYNFFKNAIDFIIFLTAAITIFRSIPAFHTFGTTLLTGAGVLAAIVGFASQSAFSNIISGIFLVIFKPFSVGDRVMIGTLYTGDIEDITLRHTVIKDFNNRRVVIPNSVINNETIINSSLVETKICIYIELTISFESVIDTAIRIIQEEAMKHALCLDNRTPQDLAKGEHPVLVRVMGFSETGTKLRASVWAKNPDDGFDLKCDLHKIIKERFDKEGVVLPYPHRVLLKNPD